MSSFAVAAHAPLVTAVALFGLDDENVDLEADLAKDYKPKVFSKGEFQPFSFYI